MSSRQEQRRIQVVQFIQIWKPQRTDWKKFTVDHFMADGMPRATIYRVVKQYLNTKSIVRRSGSGRPAKKMTREKREALRRSVNHKTGIYLNVLLQGNSDVTSHTSHERSRD